MADRQIAGDKRKFIREFIYSVYGSIDVPRSAVCKLETLKNC